MTLGGNFFETFDFKSLCFVNVEFKDFDKVFGKAVAGENDGRKVLLFMLSGKIFFAMFRVYRKSLRPMKFRAK